MTYMLIHRLVRNTCVRLMDNLYKRCVQGILVFTSSSLDHFRHKTSEELDILFRVLWIDEATFESGVNSIDNLHKWALENRHSAQGCLFLHRYGVNVWKDL
jgi:hypothetical protein